MPTHSVRACLITNPRSGSGGVDVSRVLRILRAHGWDVTVRRKERGGMATDLARQAARDGYGVVVGCGGDGTLNEIVEGLVGTDVAVGAIPGGTVNLWTRELGISRRLEVAARQLVGSVRRHVDVGCVSVNGQRKRHFLLMAGLGLDGAIMAGVSKPLKNRIGPLAVGLAGLKALPSFNPLPVRIEMGETTWEGRAGQIVIGNTRRYGGFTEFTPQAYVDDGLLDICLLTATDPVALALQAASLVLRGHPNPYSAEMHRAGQVTVYAPRAMPLQLDGGAVKLKLKDHSEAREFTYTFTVVAHGLTVLVPAAYCGDLFQGSAIAPLDLPMSNLGQDPENSGKQASHKGHKRHMRVVAVGPDTITAARTRDGLVLMIVISPDTVTRDPEGRDVSAASFLSDLTPGDLIHVKGPRNRERGIINARRITLLSRHDGAQPSRVK